MKTSRFEIGEPVHVVNNWIYYSNAIILDDMVEGKSGHMADISYKVAITKNGKTEEYWFKDYDVHHHPSWIDLDAAHGEISRNSDKIDVFTFEINNLSDHTTSEKKDGKKIRMTPEEKLRRLKANAESKIDANERLFAKCNKWLIIRGIDCPKEIENDNKAFKKSTKELMSAIKNANLRFCQKDDVTFKVTRTAHESFEAPTLAVQENPLIQLENRNGPQACGEMITGEVAAVA